MKREERIELVRSITGDPSHYKLCLVCGAIVDKDAACCPDCYAYRFDDDEEKVSNAALDLATERVTAVSHLDLSCSQE